MALFPTTRLNPDASMPISHQWFHRRFKVWVDSLDLGRWVAHQARHTLATNLLRAGAFLGYALAWQGLRFVRTVCLASGRQGFKLEKHGVATEPGGRFGD